NRGALLRAREEGRAWQRTLGNVTRIHGDREPLSIGALLSLAYPDRIGRRREGQAGRFLLRNGQGVFTDSPTLSRADLLVAAELDGDRRESRLWLGASLSEAELREHFSEQIEVKEIIEWDRDREAVVAAEREHLGAIVLAERPIRNPDPSQARAILLDWIRGSGLAVLPWTAEATQLRGRLAFVHQLLGPPWPDVSDEALRRSLDQWLGPMLGGVRGRADLDRIDLEAALLGGLPWKERRDLDLLAPTHLTMPTGSRIRVDYSDPVAPVLPVRLQEVFGTGETPRVGDGRVAVTLHLLSPAHRPVQVTRDLSGFWRSSYADVRKEMKGRYPKHYWPDDPLVAEPTRRAKPRGKGK
ncbi:MAG TPA: ATP-dependent helicase C-terminal domain-containing protein, partial [Gemmatimonadales bacterium]|nr:ATP-dependent helicase C-terminal domain-containing protein [Gemmatimonadales bacterium]